MADVEMLIVGAGPAGLRAAQVLAEAGREVLVAERGACIGPKTCAGGLTRKAVRELEALGLPRGLGLTHVPRVSFDGDAPTPVDPGTGVVRTIARARLGAVQHGWARRAGATVETGVSVHAFDLDARTVRVGDRVVRYRHLIGADGSASRVRRALGLPISRGYFAGEFNVPGYLAPSLLVAFDSARLPSGYFWVFPHTEYTSIGAGAPSALVPPPAVRRYVEDRLAGMDVGPLPSFEAATIEAAFVGFHPRADVHLAGDAAGVASGLTGEGIYAALVTGEEVAHRILDPRAPAPKTRAWLRVHRRHAVIMRAWRSRPVRAASFALLEQAVRSRRLRAATTAFFLEG